MTKTTGKAPTQTNQSFKDSRFLPSALLVLIVGLVFHKVWQHPFVAYDDQILVYNNPHYLQKNGIDYSFFWTHPFLQLFMPLTYTVWGVLSGVAPLPTPIELGDGIALRFSALPFHLLNLLLHTLNTLLVFKILKHRTSEQWAAFCGALIFAIHPLQVESVAWVSELKGVMSTFFGLICINFYIHHADEKSSVTRKKRFLLLLVALTAFCLALLSKPSAVAIPLLLLLIDVIWFRREARRTALSLIPFFSIAFFWAIISRWAQPMQSDIPEVPLWTRPFIATDALSFYLGRFIWPMHLGINYGRRPDFVLQHWWIFVTWIPIAVLGWLSLRTKESEPKLALGLFIAPVIPVLGFVPFVFQSFSTVADRYIYLSLLGPSLAVAWLLNRYKSQKLAVGLSLWLVALGTLCAQQNAVWSSTKDLFTHALEINQRDAEAHFQVATFFRQEGQLYSAIAHYQESIRLRPKDYTTYASLGDAYMEQGELEAAIRTFKSAIEINPQSATSHFNLGNAFSQKGSLPEAEEHYRACLRLKPDFGDAYNNLAITLAKQGRRTEAITSWQRGLKLQPVNPEAHFNLATALMKEGKTADAIEQYQIVIRQAPDFAPAQAALQHAMNVAKSKRP